MSLIRLPRITIFIDNQSTTLGLEDNLYEEFSKVLLKFVLMVLWKVLETLLEHFVSVRVLYTHQQIRG